MHPFLLFFLLGLCHISFFFYSWPHQKAYWTWTLNFQSIYEQEPTSCLSCPQLSSNFWFLSLFWPLKKKNVSILMGFFNYFCFSFYLIKIFFFTNSLKLFTFFLISFANSQVSWCVYSFNLKLIILFGLVCFFVLFFTAQFKNARISFSLWKYRNNSN